MCQRAFSASLIQRIKKSEFARHVSILATGSLLAQVIGLAASPIISRLYEPANYATLVLFMSIISAIAPAASGRYEIAVVVAKDEQDSDGLLVLSFWMAGTVSLLMLLVFMLCQQSLKKLLNADSLGLWWMLIPIVLFLTTAFTALKYYANRYKRYDLISRVLVAQALFGATFSIGLGLVGFQVDGLLIAALMGAIFGTALMMVIYRKDLPTMPWRKFRSMWDLSKKYKQFPVYGASTTFLDGITLALPVFILTKFFPLSIVGQYALGLRIFSAPLSFIASSVSQVHLRKVAELTHAEPAALPRYTLKLSLLLLLVVGVPSALLYFFIPQLVAFIFGDRWQTAGEILTIMLPALVIKFVASSLSGVFTATGHLKLLAIWEFAALLVTFIGLAWAARYNDYQMFFYALMTINLFLYVSLFGAIMYVTKNIRAEKFGSL